MILIVNKQSLEQIAATHKYLPDWQAVNGRYIDLFSLTERLHKLTSFNHQSCSHDGVHIIHECNYRALVTQWDFNFIKMMGIIKEYPLYPNKESK
tara:strand:+ start:1425 stop:1709 length:285 start_codon:yes stop_codon:yes gene_type:complete